MRTKLLISAVATALVVTTAAVGYSQGIEWALVNWKVRRDFPSVPRIDPKQVADWLNDSKRPQPVLLDVRTRPEYEVSHIHGARHIEPGSDAATVTAPKDTPIVTYCSVGYRSAALAKRLQEAGFTHVENMTGSIFDWANKGYPIEQNGHSAKKVHPFNARWGKLLNKELRADVPATAPAK